MNKSNMYEIRAMFFYLCFILYDIKDNKFFAGIAAVVGIGCLLVSFVNAEIDRRNRGEK